MTVIQPIQEITGILSSESKEGSCANELNNNLFRCVPKEIMLEIFQFLDLITLGR